MTTSCSKPKTLSHQLELPCGAWLRFCKWNLPMTKRSHHGAASVRQEPPLAPLSVPRAVAATGALRLPHPCQSSPEFGVVEGPVLGPMLQLASVEEQVSGKVASLWLDSQRTSKYRAKLVTVQHHIPLHTGAARKLSGQLEWAEAAVLGWQYRAFLWPFRDHEKLASPQVPSSALRAAARCLDKALADIPVRQVQTTDLKRRYCIAFTDARGRARGAAAVFCFRHMASVSLWLMHRTNASPHGCRAGSSVSTKLSPWALSSCYTQWRY